MVSDSRGQMDCYIRLTVVHPDCVAIVCADISDVSITSLAELLPKIKWLAELPAWEINTPLHNRCIPWRR